MRIWIIGSGGDCDIVVAQPRVSRLHCRFTEQADGYLVEDLGSSNGTYVNGERIAATMRVSAGDTITLGALVPMPWPPASGAPGATVVRIGRAADNDVVLDDARVSSHHARLIVSEARTLIEEAGSANGTFVNSPDRRVTEAIPLAGTDTVYLGSLPVPAARLLAARTAPERAAAVPPPLPQAPPAPAVSPPSPAPAMVTPWTMLVLAQAPVLAILIVLAFGRQAAAPATATSRPSVVEGIASTMFALAMSAVWLGGTLAVWASLAGRSSSGWEDSFEARMLASPAVRIAALGVLCVAQCAVLLAIVQWGSGLRGPWPSMFGVSALASGVGLSIGVLIFALVRTPITAVVVLVLAFAAMTAMGGRIRRLSDSNVGAPIAVAMPSRWAFEGLLLLENERRSAPDALQEEGTDRAGDLAEAFFPADTWMGPRADAMALGFVLIGLVGAVVFLSVSEKHRSSNVPGRP